MIAECFFLALLVTFAPQAAAAIHTKFAADAQPSRPKLLANSDSEATASLTASPSAFAA